MGDDGDSGALHRAATGAVMEIRRKRGCDMVVPQLKLLRFGRRRGVSDCRLGKSIFVAQASSGGRTICYS